MNQIPYTLRMLAGEEETRQGERLFHAGRVKIVEQSAKVLRCQVVEAGRYEVVISADAASHKCGCPICQENGACRHIVAALMACQDAGAMDEMIRRRAAASGPKLMAAMERTLPEEGTIRMSVRLIVEPAVGEAAQPCKLKLVLLIGEERLYVVKSIPQMLEAIETGTPIEYGKGFTFHPEWMRFGPTENRILGILRAMCLAQKEGGVALRGAEQREMALPAPYAEAILQELRKLPFSIKDGDATHSVKRVIQSRIPLHFRVSSDLRGLSVVGRFPKEFRPLTASCSFALVGDKVVHVEEAQRNVLRVLYNEQLTGGSQCQFDYPLREAARVIGELVPFLQMTAVVEIAEELQRQLIRLPLTARVYLDRAGNGKDVVARVTFRYGEREIDPFDELPLPETITRTEKLLLRDAAAERQVLDALGASGFTVSKGHVYLAGQDAIFDFVSEGVAKLQSVSEVYLSNEFKRLAPRKPKFRGRMRMNGTALEFKFEENGEPAQEIYGIMEAIARKRRYFRLKDGSFLDLSAMEEWQPLADSIYEVAQVEGIDFMTGGEDTVQMQTYRACYMESLLQGLNVPVEVDQSVHETVRALTEPGDAADAVLPAGLTLRPYQQRGVKWMQTLDRLHLGGVLADDMGLGKTVQMIALFAAAKERGVTLPSLVVCPTSVVLNWEREIARFAPHLKVLCIIGDAAERRRRLEMVADCDVVVTSYDILKRDVAHYADLDFYYHVLDEAQYIKNSNTQNARAVKSVRSVRRFALTGTPVENRLAELWSIFDFLMPGFLFSRRTFMHRFEAPIQRQEGRVAEHLRQMVAPFILRRLKQEVLTELPPKTERLLPAPMERPQRQVYLAAVSDLRRTITGGGKLSGKQRITVLSQLTRLRQICCDPRLCCEGYSGGSTKLDACMDLLREATAAGHKVLLFSQFTSMLALLRQRLEEERIAHYILQGSTPKEERARLVDTFNADDTPVFLISLKAGGVGLNLTGADMVIHYDPWWNGAVEDQATDRAHRIGQKNPVQVVRLIARDTIEEKIVGLQEQKRQLAQSVVEGDTPSLTDLTAEQLLELLE